MGNRADNLAQAKHKLSAQIKELRCSSIYETAAWGHVPQAAFLNMAVKGFTELNPFALLRFTQQIEAQFPTKPPMQWGPRYMDIDILYYGSKIIQSLELQIPHPLIENRNFVLLPLVELAAAFEHPLLGLNSTELLAQTADDGNVVPWETQN